MFVYRFVCFLGVLFALFSVPFLGELGILFFLGVSNWDSFCLEKGFF